MTMGTIIDSHSQVIPIEIRIILSLVEMTIAAIDHVKVEEVKRKRRMVGVTRNTPRPNRNI